MAARTFGVVPACAMAWLALSHAAAAQQIDYGALEQIFGEPVTTSATGSPQKASEAPADMQIITADDIRRSGATNIPEILQFLAGVDVRSDTAMDSDVAIRGYDQAQNPRLLVLINGRQVYLDDYGYVSWQSIPVQLTDIRQIEVVRGPASALFGFNAASGVVNIITYDPLTDRTDTLNLTSGTYGTYGGSLVTTAQIPGKAGVTISLGGLRMQEFSAKTIPAAGGPYYTTPNMYDYAVDARGKPADDVETTLEVTHSESDSTISVSQDFDDQAHYRIDSIKSGIAYASPYGLLTLFGYMNISKTAYMQGNDTDLDNDIGVVQASDLFKIANVHSFRIALEYRDNRGFGLLYDGSLGYQDYAASAMWNWRIDPELAWTAAGRVDHLALMRGTPLTPTDIYTQAEFQHASLTAPSFNLGLVYQPTGLDTLRWLAGRAVQAPSLLDFGLDIPFNYGPLAFLYASSPYLKPSAATNYEMDYDRALPAIDSTLHTGIYYNITQGLLTTATTSIPAYVDGVTESYSANIGSGTALGGEIGLNGTSADGWRWNLTYTLETVWDRLNSGPPLTPSDFGTTTPESEIDFGAGYSWQKWEADMQGKWQSRFIDYANYANRTAPEFIPVPIDNFVTLNARLGYSVTPALTVAVTGQQLQADETIETSGFEVERRVLFSATYDF